MFSDMDSQALMGSEVFRNLLKGEIEKEASKKEEENNTTKKALKDIEDFQIKVNASPVLKKQFKALQDRFINDPAYRESVNQDFVQGVLLLNIED